MCSSVSGPVDASPRAACRALRGPHELAEACVHPVLLERRLFPDRHVVAETKLTSMRQPAQRLLPVSKLCVRTRNVPCTLRGSAGAQLESSLECGDGLAIS